MIWQTLLHDPPVIAPWLGGHMLRLERRTWTVRPLPPEHGWYTFRLSGRTAFPEAPVPRAPSPIFAATAVVGYLVGDRIVPDGARIDPDPHALARQAETVHLLDPLARFARVRAGRPAEGAPLVFLEEVYPLGPEPDVQCALEDGHRSLDHLPHITPALDAAFRLELFQRDEAERRRQLLEQRRREDEERRVKEERRAELVRRLGDGQSRRTLAPLDFATAARAALAVGGATYLDHRGSHRPGEMVVRYRLEGRRFECVCTMDLSVTDAGICLTDHHTGVKGDTLFTLESLPVVVRQAIREDVLVVYRHVG